MRTMLLILGVLAGGVLPVRGHVPYLEAGDFSLLWPFRIRDVEQSIAVYAWLADGQDLDVYLFRIDRPTRLKTELLVPVCPDYASFFPAVALLGPGLPPPAIPLAGGYGILLNTWDDRSEPRDQFYEPFGDKSYYEGPHFDQVLEVPGVYVLVAWDPDGVGGDYVLGTGFLEQFPLPDLIRALVNTPKIRRGEELHSDCPPSRPSATR